MKNTLVILFALYAGSANAIAPVSLKVVFQRQTVNADETIRVYKVRCENGTTGMITGTLGKREWCVNNLNCRMGKIAAAKLSCNPRRLKTSADSDN